MTPYDIDIDIHNITEQELNNYELIDIRETEEIEEWPPLKTCRHIPFSQFPMNIDQFDKTKSYLLFCAKGGRSHYMAEAMKHEGFTALSVNNGIASVNSFLKKLSS